MIADKVVVAVYKSSRKDETYLYVKKQDGLNKIPESLLTVFGEPQPVMTLVLHSEKKLARVTADQVLDAITEQGFYLQMPPPKEEYLVALPDELLCFNDPE
ncbi:YcgL domain-containing protein [Zooshikella ganghwensis]|uniref:YcgL domain-containing protein n=1 Tax=Zooshikella ganghwensis TaxID=202772 RepID=UPI00040E8BDF|nr:YcgL domain-containing protein [Zooshikella ganghwensis]